MNSLYILDVNSFSDMWVANIFSPSVGCLFILLMVSSAEQKLFGSEVVPFVYSEQDTAPIPAAFTVCSRRQKYKPALIAF